MTGINVCQMIWSLFINTFRLYRMDVRIVFIVVTVVPGDASSGPPLL